MKRIKVSVATIVFVVSADFAFAQQDSIAKEKLIEDVVIISTAKKNAESNIINLQKKEVGVIERIGSVQLGKQGVGDVSIAVTKATGSQKQEGSGQIFIRGLGDRNNSTTINGLSTASNDPMYKNIDLSLIKTDMIDFVELKKVYTPLLWGDVSGANVNIITKVYTGKPYFRLNIGSSVNTNAVGKNNFYLQDGYTFWGIKPVHKPKNAEIIKKGYAFTTKWNDRKIFLPINTSLGFDFGRSFNIGSEGKLSLFGFGGFDNGYSFVEGIIGSSFDNVGNALKDLKGEEFKYNTSTTGLLNLNYKINSRNSLNYSLNFIHTTDQKLGNYKGYIRDVNEQPGETAFFRRALYKANDMLVQQLRGEHTIKALEILWNIGHTGLDSRRPDRQQNIAVYDSSTQLYHFIGSNPAANHRYFDRLVENDYTGDIQLRYKLSDRAKFTLGYASRYKDSDFRAIQYNFKVKKSPNDYHLDIDNLDNFFNGTNYALGNVFDIVTFRGNIAWNPDISLAPQFFRSEILNNAGFLNIEYKFSKKLTGELGVRYDKLQQEITYNSSLFPNGGKINKNYNKVLPALNIKYEANSKNNLRLSASKTYTTPLLIEVAPYEYEEVDEISFGNVDLTLADNYNLDLKWEYFPSKGEIISVAVFGKYILNPIARVTVNSSANAVSFVNTGDSGRVLGTEIEIRKNLLKVKNTEIYVFLNASYLKTTQNLDDKKVRSENPTSKVSVDFIKSEDKMQGASDIIANINLGWKQKWGNKNSLDFIVSYSYTSSNIYALGYQNKGNIVDKPIGLLDAILKIKLNNGLGISLSGKNLLNPNYKRVQSNENSEVVTRSFKKGQGYGIGFHYEF